MWKFQLSKSLVPKLGLGRLKAVRNTDNRNRILSCGDSYTSPSIYARRMYMTNFSRSTTSLDGTDNRDVHSVQKQRIVSDFSLQVESKAESLEAIWSATEPRVSSAESTLTLQSKRKLRDGNEIPVLGFGTYEIDGPDAYRCVLWALEAGYRHIDSAAWYGNEKECGQAILDFCKSSNISRADIFFTTKLKLNNGYIGVKKAIQESLNKCGLGYVDLYLIHGPLGGPQARKESWQAICEAQAEGKLKSIGISTFGLHHMQEMVDTCVPLPVIHQIDLHPFMARTDVVAFCKQHSITLEAWAPLVRGLRFKHPLIAGLAEKHNRTPAQILLRYSLQKGYVALPKSVSRHRIISNTHLFDFELSQNEMDHLDNLDEALITDWDPTECP